MSTTLFTGGQTFGSGLRDARLTDAAMLEMLQVYKRRVAGNYRALPPRVWVSSVPQKCGSLVR